MTNHEKIDAWSLELKIPRPIHLTIIKFKLSIKSCLYIQINNGNISKSQIIHFVTLVNGRKIQELYLLIIFVFSCSSLFLNVNTHLCYSLLQYLESKRL